MSALFRLPRNARRATKLVNQVRFAFRHVYHSASARILMPDRDYSVDSNVARCNSLITELSRGGRIHEARKVFDEMSERDVVTWTTIISGYIKCGMMAEARQLFEKAEARRNVVTWTALLGGYVKSGEIDEAERLFEKMPHKNVVSWNTMIDGYAQRGQIDLALELFHKMPEKNVVSWNTVIAALAQCGRINEAKRLFDKMPRKDVISWTAMIAGFSQNGMVDEAQNLFYRMPERNIVSWNAMITGYAQNGRLDDAFDLFKRMPERDLPSWNTMITGFMQNRDMERAQRLFDEMPRRNVVSWTSVITGYVQEGQCEEALKVFSMMVREGTVKPNQSTFVSVLGACSDSAGLCEGQQIHQVISKTTYQGTAFVVSALINMYSKCGELGIARKMFDDGLSSQRDLVSWNGIITAYAHHGCGKEAISLFDEMIELGFKPNDVTYVGLLSACSHAGLVEEGLKYYDELMRDGSIQIREDHYACLVDLCGRAGQLQRALDLIEWLQSKPSGAVWGALLAGCNLHGNSEIGKVAAQRLLEVEPENAGTYLLLSNIYASTGKWREAATVRSKMKHDGLKKQPGCSWIEVWNQFHVFIVGDKSHCQTEVIYSLLHDLHVKMKRQKISTSENNTMNEAFLLS